MQKRTRDGIVFVEEKLCVGCKCCISACPWGTPQWDAAAGKAVKCDYCRDRVDAGLKPACVTKCAAHCLHFGRPEEFSELRRTQFAQEVMAAELRK